MDYQYEPELDFELPKFKGKLYEMGKHIAGLYAFNRLRKAISEEIPDDFVETETVTPSEDKPKHYEYVLYEDGLNRIEDLLDVLYAEYVGNTDQPDEEILDSAAYVFGMLHWLRTGGENGTQA